MIQRIQSIWFLLAALAMAGFAFLEMSDKWMIVTASTLSAISLLAGIFVYHNRKLQKRIAYLNIIIIIAIAVAAFYLLSSSMGGNPETNWLNASNSILILPVLAIIFCLLAMRGIKHDEQLLRSADRLR